MNTSFPIRDADILFGNWKRAISLLRIFSMKTRWCCFGPVARTEMYFFFNFRPHHWFDPRVGVNVLDFQLQWKNFCLWLFELMYALYPFEKKHVLFFSSAYLSDHPPPNPHPLAHSLSGLSCHSPIALRPLFCISCRLQLCSSFLCSLLVRYRYHFSLSNTPLSVCLSFTLEAA